MESEREVLEQIAQWVEREERGAQATKRLAEFIRSARGYRWVGIYEVISTEVRAIAWTGSEAPAYPRFPISQGLSGAAVQSRAPVLVADVRNDPRYLTTFESCASLILPMFG